MKKIFAVLSVLALSTAMVAAQDPQPTTQNQTTQTDVGQPTDTNEPVFKGCLSGSKDNYVLTTSDGKSFRLHSDKDINEHVGKMVEIRGTMKKEGVDRPDDAAARMSEIDVADVKSVEGGSCPPASDSSAAASTEAPVKSDATDQAAASTATEPAAASQATVTEQKATEPVATETKPEVSAQASTTSEPAASAAVSTENSTAAVSADPQTGVNADVDANKATDTTATASTGTEQNAQADAAQLPETASALPLLGLLGFIATGFGLVMRRK